MSNLVIGWNYQNDMLVTLSGLQSSTAAASSYINSSTGVTAKVWNGLSTGSTGTVLKSLNLPYSTGSNGVYRGIVQSTDATWTIGGRGFVQVIVNHSGLNGDFRQHYRVQTRGTT